MSRQRVPRPVIGMALAVLLLVACAPAATPAPDTPTPAPTSTSIPPTPTPTELPTPTTEPAWDYVALGDSNPAGHGATKSYVDMFAEYIAADLGVEVRLQNLAFDGATSAEISIGLKTDRDLQQAIREAEIVTIDVGANDWAPAAEAFPANTCGGADNQDCLRRLIEADRHTFQGILDNLTELQADNPTRLVRVVDLYLSNCDFPHFYGNADLHNAIKPYLDEFNAIIEETTVAHGGKVVPLYQALSGPDGSTNPVDYLQRDQCHLNTKGHQKVADLLRELGYEE